MTCQLSSVRRAYGFAEAAPSPINVTVRQIGLQTEYCLN